MYTYPNEPAHYTASSDAAIAWTLQQDEIRRQQRRAANTHASPSSQSSQLPRLSSWPVPSQRLTPAYKAPSEYESDAVARQRIVQRLSQYQLIEKRIKGDGACQFRAIADQLFGTETEHTRVRANVCFQMYRYPDLYQPHVPGNYAAYCARMQQLTTWGDHVTLQAAADAYGVRILVLTSWRDSEVVEVVPRQQQSEKMLYLSFWGGSHYNSVYQRGVGMGGGSSSGVKVLGSKKLGRLSQLLFP